MKNIEKQGRILPNGDIAMPPQVVFTQSNNPFLIKGKKLQLVTPEYLQKHGAPIEKKFQLADELEEIVLKNTKVLFGERILMVKIKKTGIEFLEAFDSGNFLFDLNDLEKPKIYLLQFFYSKKNFFTFFFGITTILAFLKNQDNWLEITGKLFDIIEADKVLNKELKTLIGKMTIPEFLNKIFILG